MKDLSTIPLHYSIYQPLSGSTKAIVLILHGMQEHSGRYQNFVNYLTEERYAVVIYDHVGHGKTATSAAQQGFFRTEKPAKLLVENALKMAFLARQKFPNQPIILIGHSMGSFIARLVLNEAAHLFKGAIIMGTSGSNLLASAFLPLLQVFNYIAPERRSKWLNNLFNNINNRKFRREEPHDGTNWLSVNRANRKAFQSDERCGIAFSNNAFYGLVTLNVLATKATWSENIPFRFPLLFLSGSDDPIGNFARGVLKTVADLKNDGFSKVDVRIYENMRHEILQERDRQLVYNDIDRWLTKILASG